MKSFCFVFHFWFLEGGCQGLEFFVTCLSPGRGTFWHTCSVRFCWAVPRTSSTAGRGLCFLPHLRVSLNPRSSVPVPFADLLWAPLRPGASGLPTLADYGKWEQNRKSINRPAWVLSTYFWQECEGRSLQKNGLFNKWQWNIYTFLTSGAQTFINMK